MVKTKINEAYDFAVREIWSFDNLKEMEDTTSERYKLAISWSIPNGLAQRFCKDLRRFKPEFWNTAAASVGLMALRTASYWLYTYVCFKYLNHRTFHFQNLSILHLNVPYPLQKHKLHYHYDKSVLLQNNHNGFFSQSFLEIPQTSLQNVAIAHETNNVLRLSIHWMRAQ